jgi:hypothetical protein
MSQSGSAVKRPTGQNRLHTLHQQLPFQSVSLASSAPGYAFFSARTWQSASHDFPAGFISCCSQQVHILTGQPMKAPDRCLTARMWSVRTARLIPLQCQVSWPRTNVIMLVRSSSLALGCCLLGFLIREEHKRFWPAKLCVKHESRLHFWHFTKGSRHPRSTKV